MALGTSSSPRQSGCSMDDVRRDIDRFLDPSVRSLCRSQAGDHGKAMEETLQDVGCGDDVVGSDDGNDRRGVAWKRSSMEIMKLRCAKEGLQSELEDSRQEAEELMSRREREAGRDAASIMRITQERDELRQDGRAKKRRLSEIEDELFRLQVERDTLARNFEELSENSRRELEAMRHKALAESQKCNDELAVLRQELIAAQQQREQNHTLAVGNENSKVLKARVSDLEGEVSSLRMALQEASPENDLAAQLRARHAEYEKELQDSRKSLEELHSVRGLAMQLEQEAGSLKAALAVRDKALEEAEDAAEGAASMRRDLAAFFAAAAEIVASAKQTCADDAEAAILPSEKPSPLHLSLAWSRLQAHRSKNAFNASESQQLLDEAAVRERQLQAEIRQLRVYLSAQEANSEELRVNLRSARDDNAALLARESVLREALAGNTKSSSATAGWPASAVAGDATEVAALKQRQNELEELLASKRQALANASKEVEALRTEVNKLAGAEARGQRLERVNAELWQANKELENRTSQLERQQEEAGEDADYDRRTTKILHLAQGPSGRAATGGLSNEKAGHERSGDLEHQQAARQLERFKKATKKYVQDFREGVYSLLGWKIEMKGEGSNMRWHLMSRYQEGQELVFQLQPSSAGRPAEFDLLGTSWAEQLQGDRQAMAYLEIYSSIPGFLAHVTTDLLSQQTFTR